MITPRSLFRGCNLLWLAAFLALTALTQIGGLVLLLSMMAGRRLRLPWWGKGGLFIGLYLAATLAVVPVLAPVFGREALDCTATAARHYQANSFYYCLTNRNYVRPPVKSALSRIAAEVAERYPGAVVTYLDASFPFADGFPMPPHLSHKDGRKIDLALFYQGRDIAGAWFLGYWAFPDVSAGFVSPCEQDGLFRWNMAWLQPLLPQAELDDRRNRALVEVVLKEAPQKLLIEPHLAGRLHLDGPGILFAGCHAARHDDHVHVQWQ